MEKYNNRVHTTTRLTPFEAGNDKLIPSNNNHHTEGASCTATLASHNDSIKIPKFQIGDFVRVPDKRNLYSKGYTTNWNREFFKKHQLNPTNPVTYG